MSGNVTIKDYKTYIEKLYGFVSGFETSVFPILLPAVADVEQRRKLHLLQHDIETMGGNVKELPAISPSVFETVYASVPAALGGMYVLEGSVLGGVIITNHLQKILGPAVAGSTLYLNAYSPNTGSRWKSFLQQLSTGATGVEDEIISSAVETFELIDQWLTSSNIKKPKHKNG